MSHTQGPWRAYKDASLRHTIGTAYVRICDMWGRDPAFHSDEDAANARLIAAAPDLEAALKQWISMAVNSGLEGCDEILEQAEAAIAKATGGHTDLDTIDLSHDLGLRDLTSQFGEVE